MQSIALLIILTLTVHCHANKIGARNGEGFDSKGDRRRAKILGKGGKFGKGHISSEDAFHEAPTPYPTSTTFKSSLPSSTAKPTHSTVPFFPPSPISSKQPTPQGTKQPTKISSPSSVTQGPSYLPTRFESASSTAEPTPFKSFMNPTFSPSKIEPYLYFPGQDVFNCPNTRNVPSWTIDFEFQYQIRVQAGVELDDTTLSRIEIQLTQAVADDILSCYNTNGLPPGQRRLLEDVLEVYAAPEDHLLGSCGNGCYLIRGQMTFQVAEVSQAKHLTCTRLGILQDEDKLYRIVMSLEGVQTLDVDSTSLVCKYESSPIMGDVGKDSDGDTSEDESRSSMRSYVGITLAGMVSLMLILAVFKRRNYSNEDDTNKGMYTIQAADTMMSSPSNDSHIDNKVLSKDVLQEVPQGSLPSEGPSIIPIKEDDSSNSSSGELKSPEVDIGAFLQKAKPPESIVQILGNGIASVVSVCDLEDSLAAAPYDEEVSL